MLNSTEKASSLDIPMSGSLRSYVKVKPGEEFDSALSALIDAASLDIKSRLGSE